MSNPLISILIPAYKPNWLDTTIASALSQTYNNFEIIVSDDCPSDDVQSIVSKWKDRRIRYIKNPTRGLPGSNRDFLIKNSNGDYLKFLFDDDFLFPNSLQILANACFKSNSKFSFHLRLFVDNFGRVIGAPEEINKILSISNLISPNKFFQEIIKKSKNLIGEPSNVLIQSEMLKKMNCPFAINGRRMRFLTDVALYTNIAASGENFIGVQEYGSAFRISNLQSSNEESPILSAGFYEWEFIKRWATQNNYLSYEDFNEGRSHQNEIYAHWANKFPELENFLGSRIEERKEILNNNFLETLDIADLTIALRILNRVL
jgi:glycosyltransferase involved in cell wall biosynthesis